MKRRVRRQKLICECGDGVRKEVRKKRSGRRADEGERDFREELETRGQLLFLCVYIVVF